MDAKFIPQERLRVFISSAQNNEKGYAWSETRKKIKAHLAECPYLNPFIIEDLASAIPSNSLFEYQVQQSDVVVLLVKGELRKGTATEFAVATKHKKPLLVYFLDDDAPNPEVEQLKKTIQNTDYCTYHYMESFDNIEVHVRNEVIEDVIRYYQYKHFKDSISDGGQNSVDLLTTPLPSAMELSKACIPTKTSIDLFSSSYNHIYDLLGLSYLKKDYEGSDSEYHNLGKDVLDWLLTGKKIECIEEIHSLIERCQDLYGSIDWLVMRWEAIRYEMDDNPQKALEKERQALELAKAEKLPTWIINDILIDCRNMENEVNQMNRIFYSESDAQEEINKSATIVYMPVLDRYLENAYEAVVREEIKIDTAALGTQFYGSSIGAVITDIENYFFSAMLYGSYSHMHLTRRSLANILYKYAELADDSLLYLNAVKLKILNGAEKEFRQLIQHKWDSIYAGITSTANELWRLAANTPIAYRDAMKQSVLTMLGLYLTDDEFITAENYLSTVALEVYWGNSQLFFECIYSNINRLCPKNVVAMIVPIIDDRRFHIGDNLSNILLQLKIKDVDTSLQEQLCSALEKQMSFIVENNGSPQIIAALENQNEKIFSVLAKLPKNGLEGPEKTLYDINRGTGDWRRLLEDEISMARNHFEANKDTTAYREFGARPYSMIQRIVKEYYKSDMNEIIIERFIPLCIEVLESQVVAQIKSECINCLTDIMVFCGLDSTLIPEELKTAVSQIDIAQCRTIQFVSSTGKEAFASRVIMLKVISGIGNKDQLLELCFGYSRKTTQERAILAECIEQYLIFEKGNNIKVDTAILAIILQCFEDDHYTVRYRACNCLVQLLNTQNRDIGEQKLYEAAIDTSHYVRNNVLRLCKEGKITDVAVCDCLIDILKKDANYAIRQYAMS